MLEKSVDEVIIEASLYFKWNGWYSFAIPICSKYVLYFTLLYLYSGNMIPIIFFYKFANDIIFPV